jgi:hypothetical protein
MYVVGGSSVEPVVLDNAVLEQIASSVPIVSADWISDSVRDSARHPLERYQVSIVTKDEAARAAMEQAMREEEERKREEARHDMPANPCERYTPLTSPNDDIVEVFLELEKYYEAIGDPGHRALSYRRAAAALKVTHLTEVCFKYRRRSLMR